MHKVQRILVCPTACIQHLVNSFAGLPRKCTWRKYLAAQQVHSNCDFIFAGFESSCLVPRPSFQLVPLLKLNPISVIDTGKVVHPDSPCSSAQYTDMPTNTRPPSNLSKSTRSPNIAMFGSLTATSNHNSSSHTLCITCLLAPACQQ